MYKPFTSACALITLVEAKNIRRDLQGSFTPPSEISSLTQEKFTPSSSQLSELEKQIASIENEISVT